MAVTGAGRNRAPPPPLPAADEVHRTGCDAAESVNPAKVPTASVANNPVGATGTRRTSGPAALPSAAPTERARPEARILFWKRETLAYQPQTDYDKTRVS